MKKLSIIILTIIIIIMISCSKNKLTYPNPDAKILFLHHSTGQNVWKGKLNGLASLSMRLGSSLVPKLLKEYNKVNGKKYAIYEIWFPNNPYPIENNPYDYYNIWVKNAGQKPFMEQPTLEMLTAEYDMIIFKHCFPVSNILADDSLPDINSSKKTIANYKLQYNALKNKLKEFPKIKFIVWTGAASVEKATTPEEAKRAKDFIGWVKNEWDEPDDNIFIFDFNQIETEGELYLKPEYAKSLTDSHPNEILSKKAAELLVNRIIEVLENNK
jgi:hypothetical protein